MTCKFFFSPVIKYDTLSLVITMLKLQNLSLPLDFGPEALRQKAAKLLGISPASIDRVRLLRRSVDARKKSDVRYICTIAVTVADINILYGKNDAKIVEAIRSAEQLFTIEDHNINGGLGSYISRLSTEHAPRKVKRIALTTYGESGPAKELADQYGYSPEAIAQTVVETLR